MASSGAALPAGLLVASLDKAGGLLVIRRGYPAYRSFAVRHLGSQMVLKKACGPTQGLIIINANHVQWFAVQMTAANEFDPIIRQFVVSPIAGRTGGACFVS